MNYLGFCQSVVKRNWVNSCNNATQYIMSLPSFSPNPISRRLKAVCKQSGAFFFRWMQWLLWMLWTVFRRPTFCCIKFRSFTTSPSAPRSFCKFFANCTAVLGSAGLSLGWQENKTPTFNISSETQCKFNVKWLRAANQSTFSVFSTAASRIFS